MPEYDSHHHVVKTTAQWKERAVEYWVVPRGCLCVELTPEHKTKLKVGEGNKYYAQLPYICEGHELEDYYTKEEIDRLLDNLNRMAIQSTEEYNSKNDLPLDGNKLGDVRFVKSASPETKIDPDVYLWNGDRWIFVGYDLVEIDLSQYLKKEEFHSYFDPVSEKVDEMYPKMHTHENKSVLDQTERPYTIADKEKLDSLHNYDDTEIRELIEETGHTHWNKNVLDTITPESLWTVEDRTKFESLHNYDDSELRGRVNTLESKAHTHSNKDVLDRTTAPFTTEDKTKLDSLENVDVFVGTDGRYPGIKGLVPAPSVMDIGKFLSASGEWELAGITTAFVGATPTTDGVIGLVPAPVMGEQSYYLRGDGTWARVKSGGDKYKAGEGIYILSGEVTADSFPFKLYAKGGYVKQYIIYGAPGGVGDWNSETGKYHIPIRVSAEGHTPIETVIQIDQKLYENDWINYELQEYSVYRTVLRNDLEAIRVSNYSSITTSGAISNVPGSWGAQYGITDYYEIDPDAIYEMPPEGRAVYNYANVNMYDANKNRTRTILRSQTAAVQIIPQPGEKYLRIAAPLGIFTATFDSPVLTRLADTIFPVTIPLQQINLIPNSINTIDVLTTVKPLDMYVETVVPPDPDPDDPMSEYTGIIYNDGILDVTQEDPNNLNELTFHYRDNVDKTITIPAPELPIASDTTLGGIKVGNNLTIDPVTGVLDATGGGTTYTEGDGIEFGRPILETYQVLDKIRKPSGTTLTTDVMPSGTTDFFCDLKYYKYAGDSFLILCYDGERGSFCYTPATTASGSWARMWIYTAHENWYDLYLNGSFASSSPIVAHLRWGNTMSMSFDHTSTSAQNTPGVLPGHNPFKFDSNSDADLYWAKFYENSALVGELIPVIRQSDNVVGLFNTVTETFSTASGLTPGTPTGETIVIYDPSSTQNIPINAKLGNGLQFDTNDAIEVKLGSGLHLDTNGAIETTGRAIAEYEAGQGILFSDDTSVINAGNQAYYFDSMITCRVDGENYQRTFNKSTTEPALGAIVTVRDPGNNTLWSGPVFVGLTQSSAKNNYNNNTVNGPLTYKGLTWYSSKQNDWADGEVSDSLEHLQKIPGIFVNSNIDGIAKAIIDAANIVSNKIINAKLGEGLSFDSNNAVELDKATDSSIGGVIVGDGLIIDANGVLSIDSSDIGEYEAGEAIRFTKHTPQILPAAYQLVDYIESTGTQGIELNYVPSSSYIKYELTFSDIVFANTDFHYLIGGYAGDAVGMRAPSIDYNFANWPNKVAVPCGRNDPITNGEIPSDMTVPHTYTLTVSNGSVSLQLDNGVVRTGSYSGDISQKVGLFCSPSYTAGDPSAIFQTSAYKFHELKIYEGSSNSNLTLIHHYYPCYRISDDVPGIYDIITDTFLTNVGTGDLIIGTITGTPVINVQHGDGLEVDANNDLNVKLGSGLSFDTNDAITVDEMTGATDQADGTAGTVPAPLTGDENKFLRGDGTWSVVQSGEEYSAGAHINFTRAGLVPAAYTQIQYAESAENSTVYLDTGYPGNVGFTAVIDLQFYPSYHRQLMGIYPGTGDYFGSNGDEHFEMGGNGVMGSSDTTQRNTVTWHHTLTSPARLEWNGVSVTDNNGYGGYNSNFKLFSPFSDYRSQVKIYSCVIYDNNDQVVRNFIPCKTSLGVVGFYDTVTELFYSGQTGSLIAGPEIPPSGPTAINADEMVGADGTNAGEAGVVPAPTATDNTKFLRGDGTWAEVSGSGGNYEAGTGIRIISDQGSTVSNTLKVYANGTAQAIDYTIDGATGGVGEPSINLMPQLTTSSIWANTWYENGTHEGQPAFSKNTWYGGITNEVYLTEGIYTFSLDVKLSSTSVQGLLANELNDQSRYPHYNQAATVNLMHYGPFYPVDTDWHRYSYTFEVTSAGYVACRAENVSSSSATITVARPQLEVGSVAHDYVEHEHYVIPIIVSAPNETDIETFIELSAPLGNGDSINYIDDSLPPLPLYQNKVNTITVISAVAPSRLKIDARAEGAAEYSSIIENTGLLSVEQDPDDGHVLTFETIDGDINVIIPAPDPLTASHGIDIVNDDIEANLGSGLQLDANDAIEVKPATENSIGGIKVGEGLSVGQDGTLDVIADVVTTFTEGDAIEFGNATDPSLDNITHLKWSISTIRDRSQYMLQAAEIEFYDEDDQLLTFSALSGSYDLWDTSITQTPNYVFYQYSHTPEHLIDGDLFYKVCVDNYNSNVKTLDFVFQLENPLPAYELKRYRWYTGGDAPERDPISWAVYASPNGIDWILVHEITNASVPTARQASTEYFTLSKPVWHERSINVKYGAGLALDANGALTVVGGGGTEYDAGPGIEIGPSPSTLYTQVEYLKSTGTQSILTDIQIELTNKYVADIKLDTFLGYISETRSYIFGGSHYLVQFGTNSDQSYASFLLGVSWSGSFGQIGGVNGITERGTIVAKRGSSTCSWTTTTYGTQTASVGIAEYSDAGLLTIFGSSATSAYNSYEMRLYSFKIYDNTDQLVNNLIPVKRNSDDELGLYDLITNTFYPNTGTGTFTAGSEVGPIPGDNEVINAKLGVGLTFDNNDAITLDETTDLVFNCDYSSE